MRFHELCICHEVEIGGDSNESLEEGTGLNDLERQVWKSQVLNEADSW